LLALTLPCALLTNTEKKKEGIVSRQIIDTLQEKSTQRGERERKEFGNCRRGTEGRTDERRREREWN